jgi:hypothetical protein
MRGLAVVTLLSSVTLISSSGNHNWWPWKLQCIFSCLLVTRGVHGRTSLSKRLLENPGPPWWELSECTFFKCPLWRCHLSKGPWGGGPKGGVGSDQSNHFSGFSRSLSEGGSAVNTPTVADKIKLFGLKEWHSRDLQMHSLNQKASFPRALPTVKGRVVAIKFLFNDLFFYYVLLYYKNNINKIAIVYEIH